MARNNEDNLDFKVIKDFGSFGEGKWQKHLTLTKWGDNEPKYDLRPWNEDMTKMGKGVTLDSSDLFDLLGLIEDALDDTLDDGDSESEVEE